MCAGDRVSSASVAPISHGNSQAAPTPRANKSSHVAGSAPFLADMVLRSPNFNRGWSGETALEALLEARVWVGRGELCACNVQAGLGLGVR